MRSPPEPGSLATVSTLVAGAAVVAGLALGPDGRLDPPSSELFAVAAGFVPVGLFLVRHRPDSSTARLTHLVGLLALAGLAAASWSGTTGGAWLTQWTWWPPLALVPVLLLGFPDGSAGTASRRGARVLLAVAIGSTTVLATAATTAPRTLLTSTETSLPPTARALLAGFTALAAVSVGGLLVTFVALLRRAGRASGPTRAQLLWLTPAAVLLPLGIALDVLAVPFALVPAALALPVGIGVAVLEHRFDDLDQVVHRGAVRVILTVVVVGVYTGALLLVEPMTRAARPGLVAVLLLAAAAVLLDPVRRRLQGIVEHVLYGRRDDPYAVLASLGQRLSAVGAPDEMLRASADAIVESLRLPRASVEVDVEDRRVVVADSGRADTDAVTFPLTGEEGEVGALTVWTRRSGEDLTPAEHRLLGEVARQAAVAAGAHRLTLALRAARERLVLAREEERLRLRRDFHDGIGPVIAGARMQLQAALPHLDGNERGLVGDVLDDLGALGRSVREVVDGLRPAALDQGLEVALARTAASMAAGTEVQVVIEGAVDDLPPAVEVATYRIVAEALHNVVRHSGARRIRVQVTRLDDLRISVRDNGSGVSRGATPGVGTESMRARAEELGGTLSVTSRADGTVVEAVLPVASLGTVEVRDGSSSR